MVNAFAMSRGNPRLVYYDTYVPVLRDLVMTVFVAVQAPELVSRDLRSRVLPLYFSRPIKPGDYPLAKYLGFTAACLVMLEVPLLLLYGGAVANVHGGAAVWAQTRALIPGLLVGLMWAVSLAAISLFLASLTGRRGFATGTVAIVLPAHLHPRRRSCSRSKPDRHATGARAARRRPAGADLAEKVCRPVQPVHPVRRRAQVARRHQSGDNVPCPAPSAWSTPSS